MSSLCFQAEELPTWASCDQTAREIRIINVLVTMLTVSYSQPTYTVITVRDDVFVIRSSRFRKASRSVLEPECNRTASERLPSAEIVGLWGMGHVSTAFIKEDRLVEMSPFGGRPRLNRVSIGSNVWRTTREHICDDVVIGAGAVVEKHREGWYLCEESCCCSPRPVGSD